MESRDREQDEMEHTKERAARKMELQRYKDEEEEFNLRDMLRTDPRSLIASYNR